MASEDWGAVTFDELFDRVGDTPTIQELVRSLVKQKNSNGALASNDAQPIVNTDPAFEWWTAPNPHNKVMPVNYKPLVAQKRAPRILKKRVFNGTEPEKSLKHVRFEIEEFVNNDGMSLVKNRLLALGAKAKRAKGVNYRQLKKERAALKEQKKDNNVLLLKKPLKKKERKKKRA